MKKSNCVISRLIGLCFLTVLSVNVNAQLDSTTGFTKYVVDKSKKNNTVKSQEQQAAAALLLPPSGGCTLIGTTTVTGGGTYSYALSCSESIYADYWGITGGTIIDANGEEVVVQWCSNSCGSGSVRAYTEATGLIASKNVTISSPAVLSGGTISNPTQTINYNGTAQINASVATGGSCGGAYSYQWQKSSIIDGIYTDIAGATGQNYLTANLTAATYFRRKVTCGTTAYTTNIATITVAGALYGGYVTNPNQTIQPNAVPTQINATVPTGGNCGGSYSYQWMSATVADPDFVNIPGATGQNYQPGALTVTTYFGRKTTCNGEVAYLETNGTVSVIQPLNGGCITSGDQSIIFGNLPDAITATPAFDGNCSGNYLYQWQSSLDNVYFTNVPGATSQNLSFSAPLSQTTWFQRKTTCGSELKYTGSVKVAMVSFCSTEKTGVSVTNTIYNSFTVSWTNPASYIGTEVRYRIQGETAWRVPNASGNATGSFNGSLNAFTFTSGFTSGVTYEVRVRNECSTGSMSSGITVSGQATSNPQPVTVTLKNYFIGDTFPASIRLRFKQGSTIIQANIFPATKSGSINISVPSGTYQLEFTMPFGFSTYYVSYDVNNPFQYWDNGGIGLVLTTGNVTFNAGTAYTINASNALAF